MRMNSNVGFFIQQGIFNFLSEKSFAFQLLQTQVLNFISLVKWVDAGAAQKLSVDIGLSAAA